MLKTYLKRTWWAWALLVASIVVEVVMVNHPVIGGIRGTFGQLRYWHGDWILSLSRADVLWLTSTVTYIVSGLWAGIQLIRIAVKDMREERKLAVLETEGEQG